MQKLKHIAEFGLLERLLSELRQAQDGGAAFEALCRTAGAVGFHVGMFSSKLSGPGWFENISETTYPVEWVERYIAMGYQKTDPTRRFGPLIPHPFFWREILPLVRKKELIVLEEAQDFGLAAGVTVPLYSGGSLVGGLGLSSASRHVEDARLKAILGLAGHIFMTFYENFVHERNKTQANVLISQAAPTCLTKKEMEVLLRLTLGAGNLQIAASTNTSERAVEFHVRNIFVKLGVSNRVSAVVRAVKLGLIDLD